MLQTPSKEDLSWFSLLSLCHFDQCWVVESHCPRQWTPCLRRCVNRSEGVAKRDIWALSEGEAHLQDDIVLLTDLDDIWMSHEWVQVDLIDGW